MHGISVIICCYNSSERLSETLRHLSAQEVPDDLQWEILLVDNASTDNTAARARELWQQHPPHHAECRIVDEPQAGQMHARKTGVREAKYEYIIFCDDDNWLHKDYVRVAAEMLSQDTHIGAGGGQNTPVTNADAYPEWFEEYQDKYALGIPAPSSGDITVRGFVLGAGMVTRRALFMEAFDNKYPSLLNGRNGEKLSTGDDFEYCKRLLLWDYRLHYDQRLRLQHFIPKERLTLSYRERLMEGIFDAGNIIGEYDRALYIYTRNKHKNKARLLLLAPFRILFARLGWSRRDLQEEKLKFFYLSPLPLKASPARMFIKQFKKRK